LKKNSAKCTNFEVSSLGLELQVPSLRLGVFDEVSLLVSSRNFTQAWSRKLRSRLHHCFLHSNKHIAK